MSQASWPDGHSCLAVGETEQRGKVRKHKIAEREKEREKDQERAIFSLCVCQCVFSGRIDHPMANSEMCPLHVAPSG